MLAVIDNKLLKNIHTLAVDGSRYPETARVFYFKQMKKTFYFSHDFEPTSDPKIQALISEYGGLGYGSFCFPSNFFKVIIAVIFPPLGEVVNIIGNDVTYDMPFLNWKVISNLVKYENLNKIVYSFLLTTLFYIPGLVYTLRNISDTDINPL